MWNFSGAEEKESLWVVSYCSIRYSMMAPDSQSWTPVLGSSMAGTLDKIANKLKFIDLV